MKIEQLNEYYNRVTIKWNDIPQPGIQHTIQEALVEIAKISNFNTTGTYHIITPYAKYEITDIFQMKLKQIQTF